MKITRIGKVQSGQDVTIYSGYMFAFIDRDERGNCAVYEMETLKNAGGEEPEPICRFHLDKRDLISTHNNAVFFGNEYYEEGDEFPILYSNVYNNYQKCDERHEGELCAYRLTRDGNDFKTELVQVVKIGFVDDISLWKSAPGTVDVRPYGNFTMSAENGEFYAFVMRDVTQTTRYFAFSAPSVHEGDFCEELGVKKKVLSSSEIKYYFDLEYNKGIQGACTHKGLLYSIDGGCLGYAKSASLRVIDPMRREEAKYINLSDYGITEEPEGVAFEGDTCYYVAGHGDTYIIDFEG